MILAASASYEQAYQVSINLSSELVQLITKAGLPSWMDASASSQLFLENATINPNDAVLLYGNHMGPVGVSLARKIPSLCLFITDLNQTGLELTRLTVNANRISTIEILTEASLPRDFFEKCNVIFIRLPKGRLLARRWIMQAFEALKPGGSLYLAGANSAGIQSAIKDAKELFGDGQVLAYKKGNRIAQFIKRHNPKPHPEWTEAPGIAQGTWVKFPITITGHTFQVCSLPGVFSFDHLDEGTGTLLECTRFSPGSTVLDVGCGYGVIGLCASAGGVENVDLIDNNLLAIAACNETLMVNGVANAQVYAGDLLEPVASRRYDLILSNPPFHTGHEVNYQVAEALIVQSFQVLYPGGKLIIVANRFLRYGRIINEVFGNFSTLAETGKYHVLSGLKSS